MANKWLIRFIIITTCFAFCVVVVGAYTRLTQAGLSCPDWPTCYNHLTIPTSQYAIVQAEKNYPGFIVETTKAWTEMIHRYLALILGLLIFLLAAVMIYCRETIKMSLLLPLILIFLVLLQVVLGMWTVTLRLLPVVVVGHLLGGFIILSLLWWCFLHVNQGSSCQKKMPKHLKYFAGIGIIILFMQIALGGWTSSNYAALACPDFPYCTFKQFLPAANFKEAFNLFNTTGVHLSHAALMTIQVMHRLGAFITAVYLGSLAVSLLRTDLRKLGILLLLILSMQISLGILNVVWLLPLSLAILHNAVAAILLLALITIAYEIKAN